MIDKEKMLEEFKRMGQAALSMNHYELEITSLECFTAEDWKEFLSEPDIKEYVKKEMDIIRNTQMNRIIQGASSDRSLAKAQVLSSLKKFDEDESEADGPIFIYCYVPLNDQQEHAANILEVDEYGKPKA